jgi:hypothetical protein
MAAKYGKFGTGIENWKPNADKTSWVHKNNPGVHIFIRKNEYRLPGEGKYLVYHATYGRGGKIISHPFDHENTMVDARKQAMKYLKQYNNPLYWV